MGMQSAISDYAQRSEEFTQILNMEHRTQPGDVERGVSILVLLCIKRVLAGGRESWSKERASARPSQLRVF